MAPSSCIVCGSPTFRRFLLPRLPVDGAAPTPHEVRCCSSCGLAALEPQPDDATLAHLYAGAYYTHENTPRTAAAPESLPARVLLHLAWLADRGRALTEELPEVPGPLDIVELGCGGGELLEALASRGHRVVGLEPDPEARRAAVERGVAVLAGTAEQLPRALPLASADLVLMVHSLEHCRDPLAALRSARSLLRPGGRLALEVPNAESVYARAGPAWWHFDAGRHLWWWTPEALRRAVERVGFAFDRFGWSASFLHYRPDRLADEQRHWEEARAAQVRMGARPSTARRWLDLVATAAARPARKYEAVAVWANRGG